MEGPSFVNTRAFAPPPMPTQPPNFDATLYSRQVFALGEDAMRQLRGTSVLISGLGAVGVEVAKNLILGGVRSVMMQDTKRIQFNDLAANVFASEADVGRNRVDACFQQLAELNDSVHCEQSNEELSEEFVSDSKFNFNVIILTDCPFDRQLEINGWVRKHKKSMISCGARGLFSYAFVDLGNDHTIADPNGEACKEILIEHINCETGDVFTLDSIFHGLEDGEEIVFAEFVHDALNGLQTPVKTTNSGNIFNVGNALQQFAVHNIGPISRGKVRQVKVPKQIKFEPLAKQLEKPEFLTWDFAKFDEPPQLHALWQALHTFEYQMGRSPRPRDQSDADLLKTFLPENAAEVPDYILRNFAFQATGNLQPIASFIGGFVAQEVIKAVTHHTTPLKQFLYTDSLEALPGDYSTFDANKLTPKDCEPAAVFGWEFQKALAQQRWFVVGAGAIGCELLKNAAMMGLACDQQKKGQLVITDPDTIEVSNLNRQFLFRRPDVGNKKSEVAARAVRAFNPAMNITAFAEIVSGKTEHIFNDDFFASLNGVCNALDNVEARRYVDRRCVFYQLPLLESGTMGAKGNTQVVFPHLTESYSSTSDPPEKETPVCTLKNYPYQITHTIQWATAKFADYFTAPAEKANSYLADVRGFLDNLQKSAVSQQIEVLRELIRVLGEQRPQSPEACVKWARALFDELYRNNIAQMLDTFPPDAKTSLGQPFWSGTKRCPHPLHFDVNEGDHFEFVYAASILRAQLYNLSPIVDRERVAQLASEFKSAPFTPKKGVRIAETDAEEAMNEGGEMVDDDESVKILDELKRNLDKMNLRNFKPLTPIDFEKDDDNNHHIDFITAASNCRAENYDIEKADKMKTKRIAGKIIPALATTTAIVAGLVCVELYKTVEASGVRRARTPIDRFKNAFINLSSPFIAFSEPGAAKIKRYPKGQFTLWDRLELTGPKTLGQLIDWIQEQTFLEVTMMSSGVSLLYAFFQPPARFNERKNTDILTLVEDVSRARIPSHRRALVIEAIVQNGEGDDVEIPPIVYNFPQ